MPSTSYPFFSIWYGSLNLGDTSGVFMDSQFVGLVLQIPLTLTFLPPQPTFEIMLLTSDVEIFSDPSTGQKFIHNVYLNWVPGTSLPSPIGAIDDIDYIPGKPEYHKLTIDTSIGQGKHTITIIVNQDVQKGNRDDFSLKRIDVFEQVGAKIGW